MAEIFDGKSFSLKKIENLKKEVLKLKSIGIYPHLASIIVGDNPASKLYVGLKKIAGNKIGVEVSVYLLSKNTKKEKLLTLIKILNDDRNISGIMLQLPLPEKLNNSKFEILNTIDIKKDVDGLKSDSNFVHPTVKAVLQIIELAKIKLNKSFNTIAIVGKEGMVGSFLINELKNTKYKLIENSKEADILVSATGSPNIITGSMVKKDAIIIDVGSPKGDVDFDKVSPKVLFITPVPGGVGPVTITCLLENIIIACK